MTGIVGGTVTGDPLATMIEAAPTEPWCGTDRFQSDGFGLAITHHGGRDPAGYTFWSDGRSAGVIDGAITNLAELELDIPDVFEHMLRAPERTLSTLEGPFTIACVDGADDRVLLATDKIGCRIPYYTTEGGFVFASDLASIATVLDEPRVDHQGVSDLLLLGHMWSDTTLLADVKAVFPATVIEYRDGRVHRRRYWRPSYEPAKPTTAYLHEVTTSFQRAVDRTARSTGGDVGLWLSGGLDSRATAGELARHADSVDSLTTYTYDANPGGGVNPRLAGRVAETLGLRNELVPLSADRFADALAPAVTRTGGMVKWNTLLNLTAVFNIDRTDPDVLMEGLEGALLGHHLCRHHLTAPDTLVESMVQSEATLTPAAVSDLLSVPVDPLGSFRREARRCEETSFESAVVDIHFQNYYARLAHASNAVPRSRVGTRVPYADGEFLSVAARLPLSWRMGAFPLSDGELVYGVVEPKLRMIRALDHDLASIPYERSRLKPTWPYPLHVLGFYGSTALAQLRGNPTYGGRRLAATWYRSNDGLRSTIDGLIADACRRPFLSGDAVRNAQRGLGRGEGAAVDAVSAITTLELFLQRAID